MLAHIDSSDPTGVHHWLPMFATLFGTITMYWVLGMAWLREGVKRLFTLAKDFFARLK